MDAGWLGITVLKLISDNTKASTSAIVTASAEELP
jgi:hypothetical protein